MFEDSEENNAKKFSISDLGDAIIYLLAVVFFFGTWIEVAINTGLIGIVLGWFPGVALAWAWLAVTGRL